MCRDDWMRLGSAALVLLPAAALAQPGPTLEQLWQLVQRQQQEIAELRGRLSAAEDRAAGTEKQLEATADMVQAQQVAAGSGGEAAKTTVGGYGELIYNNYRQSRRDDSLDLRRVVLYLGHHFNDRVSFHTELELEHAKVEGGEESGEFSAEQAYLDLGLGPATHLRVGLQLMPLGLLNLTHEPPAFFGVERNEVETRIIPSTWRELAVGLHGEALPGLEYDLGVSSSPDAGRFNDPSAGIASMRQEGFQAKANDLALYGALAYRGVKGLLLGGGLFTGNTGQNDPAIGNARLALWELHGRYQVGDLDLSALYARGALDDAGNIAFATGYTAPKAFYGAYGQLAYHLWRRGDMELVPFVRYEDYDTQAQVPLGLIRDPLSHERLWTLGLSFYPHRQVVVKADYQRYRPDEASDRFNLGVGFQF
jgi:Phosphate-selective porin O and P